MQLFSADATIVPKKIKFIFAHENMKKPPSKVAHNRPQFFFQYWPGCQNQPRIDFLYYKYVPRLWSVIFVHTTIELYWNSVIAFIVSVLQQAVLEWGSPVHPSQSCILVCLYLLEELMFYTYCLCILWFWPFDFRKTQGSNSANGLLVHITYKSWSYNITFSFQSWLYI